MFTTDTQLVVTRTVFPTGRNTTRKLAVSIRGEFLSDFCRFLVGGRGKTNKKNRQKSDKNLLRIETAKVEGIRKA